MHTSLKLKDTAERVGWTFVQSFVGVLTASGVADSLGASFDASALEAALVAGISGALVAVKQLASERLGVLTRVSAAVRKSDLDV